MAGPPVAAINMIAIFMFAEELKTIRQRLRPALRSATSANALAVRNAARANWQAQSTGKTTSSYPRSITMSVSASASYCRAEIGPERGNAEPKRQSTKMLGYILEYGTAKTPPHPHLIPAWQAQEQPFIQAIGDAAMLALL
jgi:hypothetical protein